MFGQHEIKKGLKGKVSFIGMATRAPMRPVHEASLSETFLHLLFINIYTFLMCSLQSQLQVIDSFIKLLRNHAILLAKDANLIFGKMHLFKMKFEIIFMRIAVSCQLKLYFKLGDEVGPRP